MIDVNVIKKAKEGDAQSFAMLYESIATELYRVALYTLKNPQDAEDVVSETFVEAYKGLFNLREEASFKRWMMTILSARCKRKIAGYIKEKKNIDIDEMIDLEAPAVDAPNADHVAVREALKAISEEERQIVMLATVQGYTTREVAEMLGLPHGTVSSKLHRTLKKMRAMIH